MAKRPEAAKQQVTIGRFEIERDRHIASLEYNLAGNVLQLIHTDVPKEIEGMGLASDLAHEALEWARTHGKRVDVICEFVAAYLKKHPEYADLVLH